MASVKIMGSIGSARLFDTFLNLPQLDAPSLSRLPTTRPCLPNAFTVALVSPTNSPLLGDRGPAETVMRYERHVAYTRIW